jgi:hypothetical protein
MAIESSLGCFLLSPRSISFTHGTGVQLNYFLDEYSSLTPVNYGFFEKGVKDEAHYFDSPWHRLWPCKLRGRGFLARINDSLPLATWRNHQLTNHGRKLLKELVDKTGRPSHCVAVVHDENCAIRVNSVIDILRVPYKVILYDLMHLAAPTSKNLPGLSECFVKSESVYAISEPLQDAAQSLGARVVKSISFYRPRVSVERLRKQSRHNDSVIRILVLADAKPLAFAELLTAVSRFNGCEGGKKISIDFVGNAKALPAMCCESDVRVKFHGFVSSSDRDRIASQCDIAFLAGSTYGPTECPLVKYSIPSKIGDFAALGLPVIARLSAGSAAYKQARSEYFRFVRTALSPDGIFDALVSLCQDRESIPEIRSNALRFAEERLYLPNVTTDELFRFGDKC